MYYYFFQKRSLIQENIKMLPQCPSYAPTSPNYEHNQKLKFFGELRPSAMNSLHQKTLRYETLT